MKSLAGSLLKKAKCFFFFSFLLLPFSLTLAFMAHAESSLATYDDLLHAIHEARYASQVRIEQTAEKEKVREAWETGKLIDQHILLHKERADYDKEVMPKLAGDLGISESELYRMLKFSRLYPSILAVPPELSWAHLRELMPVEDSEQRKEIAKEAAKQGWTQKQLRKEIKKRNLSLLSPNGSVGDLALDEVKPGKAGIYRVVEIAGKKHCDLGFSTFFALSGKEAELFKEGNAVRCRMPDAGSGEKQEKNFASCILNPESAPEDFYTYEAQVTQVFDGDTFHAYVNLGFGVVLEQRLRLRALDAPEIFSTEGKQAKDALEKALLRDKGKILLKVSKSDDQYGRYLVDIWVKGESINQELLDSELFTVRENE